MLWIDVGKNDMIKRVSKVDKLDDGKKMKRAPKGNDRRRRRAS